MITVRPYGKGNEGAFVALYRDCLTHYACDPAPEAVEREVLAELAAPHGTFADIAWSGDRAVGLTCWLRVFPAGLGFALYLKELFVTDAARGTGAGRALMAALAARAVATGAGQLRWETGEAQARAFYRRLGAVDDGRTHYTMAGAALRALAASG
ncbi:MAG: GNAT family N-acetyltransferase [Pseudomonadota bacterium]